ncbi:MAG: FHA domain-containing protein, partial [Gemmatimonadaceae bacterium]
MASLGALTLSADARSYSIGDDQSEFVIGRDAAADLILTDPRCSRRHARVIRVAGRVTLEPLSDHANTLLNGRVVDGRVPLRHGDIIRVGGVDIRVATAEPIEAVDTVPLYHAPHEHDRSREAANPESPPPAGAIRLPSPDSALVIGRDRAVADAIIDHPLISRRHARLTRIGDGLTIEDLGSTNGVLLNAQRISGSAALRIGDRVALGPQTFVVDREGLSPTQGVEGEGITAHGIVLEVTVDGARRKLLDDVSLAIPPARFVAILGPSGCGKSTLIRVLSGRARMSSGSVAVGDLNLERDFETIKHSLAFVPQRETLLDELTLHDALRYTARLRLSADVTAADLDKAVTAALARVGMTEHATKQIAKLSGGQRKRAALANELIARPAIIFADEVTSGLDEGTDREIMRLFKALARDGVTIVCVTHSVSNVVECCDEIVVMAAGGRTAYHGPPEGALIHFGVGSLAEVYERIASLTPQAAVVRAPSAGFRSRATVQTDRRAPLAQLPALASRTARVTIANQRGLAFIGAQSIVVGLLFRLVFGAHELPPAMQPSFVFLFGIA